MEIHIWVQPATDRPETDLEAVRVELIRTLQASLDSNDWWVNGVVADSSDS